jgi:hypothetical protein
MFGAAFSLGLLVFGGITMLALRAVIITGIFTSVSILTLPSMETGSNSTPDGGNELIVTKPRLGTVQWHPKAYFRFIVGRV